MAAKKQKYYVVWQGKKPGIYYSWAICQAQIAGYPAAKYKAFESEAEAELAFKKGHEAYIQKNPAGTGGQKAKLTPRSSKKSQDIIWDSLSVDAACSGNPGPMEYQGVNTLSKELVFHQKFSLGTNNIGEFLAIVHALALFKKEGINKPIYTDSVTAMGWVKKGKAKTNLVNNAKTKGLYEMIARAEAWLDNNDYEDMVILKWDTENWGEIPADFGRK